VSKKLTPSTLRLAVLCLLASAMFPSFSRAQVPVFKITTEDSSVKFSVKASVSVNGTFDKWDATLTYPSTDVTTGILDIKIQANSINTGSGMKNDKLKGKDFFNADQDPLITFLSKKIVQTGPATFDVQGDFTIRGASKPQTLTLTASGEGTGSGEIHGTMVFDRKDSSEVTLRHRKMKSGEGKQGSIAKRWSRRTRTSRQRQDRVPRR
jgi:polyisoprenoid-binding protein YceI